MKNDKRVIMSIIWLIVGSVLIGLSFAGKVDEFWNGMGFGLAVIGALQLIRFYRFNKNQAYREAVEIAQTDERNHFIRNKAWAWTGYVFVVTAGILVIVFRIIGQEMLSLAASSAICFMIAVYWIVYMILKRKY